MVHKKAMKTSHTMKKGEEAPDGYMNLEILGSCPACGRITSRPVKAMIDESSYAPCLCEHCGKGSVHFERMEVHHRPPINAGDQRISTPLLWILRTILICLVFLAVGVLYAGIQIHRDYTVDEMTAALKASSGKSTSEILASFYDAGIKEQTISRCLGASPFTLRRIMSGESLATPSFEANLRGLYSDYLLLHSNILFHIKYALHNTDQWYSYMNPLQEQELLSSE